VDFPWVDDIHCLPEDDARIFDYELVDLIQNGQWENIWLAPPEVLNWTQALFFAYSLSHLEPELHDISLGSFCKLVLNNDPRRVDLEALERHFVYAIDDNAIARYKWPIRRCIYAQVSYSGALFFLSSGRWYRISDSFVQEVNDDIGRIEQLERTLPDYDDESEDDYNVRISDLSSDYALMHGKIIHYGGGKSQIEFCDLVGRNGDIIHVKRYSGSRDLSHLFMQGLNSGVLFQNDPDFRRNADSYLPDPLRGRYLDTRPAFNELRVVYAIASEVDEPLNLPFFSKLSLRYAARQLRGVGYRLALSRVLILPIRALLKKNWRKRTRLKRRVLSR
jgi:uncharacterized protein (TIGR04141 family)